MKSLTTIDAAFVIRTFLFELNSNEVTLSHRRSKFSADVPDQAVIANPNLSIEVPEYAAADTKLSAEVPG